MLESGRGEQKAGAGQARLCYAQAMSLRHLIAVFCMMTLPLMAQGHDGCADGRPAGAVGVDVASSDQVGHAVSARHASAPSDGMAGAQQAGESLASIPAPDKHDCGDCDTLCLLKCSTASALTVSVLQWQNSTPETFSEHRHFPPLPAHTSRLLRPPSHFLI